MTITQVANMYLTFAIVLKSEFGDASITTFAMNAIYLTVTGIQVQPPSLLFLLVYLRPWK